MNSFKTITIIFSNKRKVCLNSTYLITILFYLFLMKKIYYLVVKDYGRVF